MWKKRLICCLIISGITFIACSNCQATPSTGEIQTAAWNEVSTLAYGAVTQESLNSTQTHVVSSAVPTQTPAVMTYLTAMAEAKWTLQTLNYLELKPSDVISKGNPPKRGNAKVSLPTVPGDYIIFASKPGNSLWYVSLDGMLQGNLLDGFILDELDPVLNLESEKLKPEIMFPSQGIPHFIFVKADRGNFDYLTTFQHASIWITDIFGNSINSWDVNTNSGIVCMKPVISPYYNWIAIDCLHRYKVGNGAGFIYGEDHMINLINLKSAESNAFTITCEPKITSTSVTSSSNFIWAQNEMDFSFQCPFGEYYLLSVLDDKVAARRFGNISGATRVLAIAPDWKKMVINIGYMPKNVDGTIPGAQIAVVNLECMFKREACEQPTVYDLPHVEPSNPDQEKYGPDLIIKFSPSGDKLVWGSPSLHGWIDLVTQEHHVFTALAGNFVDFSPEGKVLFFGINPDETRKGYLSTISLEESMSINYLARADDDNWAGIIKFYGWLTIP